MGYRSQEVKRVGPRVSSVRVAVTCHTVIKFYEAIPKCSGSAGSSSPVRPATPSAVSPTPPPPPPRPPSRPKLPPGKPTVGDVVSFALNPNFSPD